ncbi:ABC transporter permease [candidate division KSB3 bacterium]|jgi:ribose/xylose/arabinose/galactoside ABC-type transport system permease subunit|uniref:ABC transporter permease n=1 Tax=candidate division KSB3 bacterium TaxID=2044937 RepID=A0A9D5JZ92_9BACT|nr:ABC transporter permease [candidate division KSB3 bacterium]MBD3326959.1 ABC transporter permease [candidate division KSB3 bacterium]
MNTSKTPLLFVLKIREVGVLVAVILLAIIFSIANKDFLLPQNLLITIRMASELGIIAVGVTLLMIAQEFDLSVGSVFALSPMISAILYTNYGLPVVGATLIGLLISLVFGFINGVITTQTGIPSFITTLGTMMIYRALVLVIARGFPIKITSQATISNVIGGTLGGAFPVAVVWFLVFTAIGFYILQFTAFGNQITATGGNKSAAVAAGINTTKVKILLFMLVSFLAAFSGHVQCFRLGSVAPLNGRGLELAAIAACVIGGTSLFGGVGTVIGSALGVFITGMIRNGIVLLGVSVYWQDGFLGIILIVAVIVNVFISKKRG